MNSMDFHNTLLKIGLTPIEATVFIILCEHGSLTGYEVAKLSGISRSNVYAALYNLQEKGKCEISKGETTKYIPLSKEELLLTTQREMQATLNDLEQLFPVPASIHEPYITVKGYENVLSKIKNSISLCHSHLYLLTSSTLIDLLVDNLLDASKEHRISIICEKALSLPHIATYQRSKCPKGFHMIIDTESVLTGELTPHHAQCLFSKDHSLVTLMRESFITELDMIALKN